MQKAFESKLTLLQGLSRSWDRNALFNQTAAELISELTIEVHTAGTERVEFMGKLGGLRGVIEAQEAWLWTQGKQIEQGEATTPKHTWAL
ncbi:MAG: hypothetical protein C4519_18835 [Desulfobacteraceae bacterium]|nr:MAG: hypothetical protein C4519_18835 [Desulfobacteraceae bacterium]